MASCSCRPRSGAPRRLRADAVTSTFSLHTINALRPMGDAGELARRLRQRLGAQALAVELDHGEVTLRVAPADWAGVALRLRDEPHFAFEQLVDLCGVDYLEYGDGSRAGPRYAVVVHLLSLANNWRLRVRVFCADDGLPVVDSLLGVWPSCGWYE